MKEIECLPPLPVRKKNAHKGDFWRVLIIAGSQGMMGAACLTTKAALRSGAALVTLGVPQSQIQVAAIKLTCAMTTALSETSKKTLSPKAYSAICSLAKNSPIIAMGPGISQDSETCELMLSLIPTLPSTLVLDADALNCLSQKAHLLKERKAPTILTPHPGEFCRLTGEKMSRVKSHSKELAMEFANEYKCVVVLKFSSTIVTDGQQVYSNRTGNSGMATGGSGDVLTGVITGLLAQKMSAFQSAQLGVGLHGYAGDLAAQAKGEISMIASDILDFLPSAFQNYQTMGANALY